MAEYRHDHSGLRQIAVGAEMHIGLIDIVLDEAIPYAKAISPDAPPYGQGYIDSFEVQGSKVERIAGMRRATVHLVNTADHAIYVERGRGNYNMGNHVLARTADWLSRS